MNTKRIYLDNAATTWPKPDEVYRAVDDYQRNCGAAAGRGAYGEAVEADRILQQTRQGIAELIGVDDPSHIVFTLNGTDSLNLAIHGLLAPGDHVVTTVVDHNSVLRPLRWLEEHRGVRVTRVGCDTQGFVSAADVVSAVRDDTALVAVIHASNVTGAIQPVEEIGQALKGHRALFLVDAAQSLGHVPIDVDRMAVDLLAAPGHKGLFGPLGTGVLYIRPGLESRVNSVRQGGTGSQSEQDRHPEALPDKYEPGNHNMAGIAGLRAAVEYVRQRGVETLHAEEQQLTSRLLDGLAKIRGVVLYGPPDVSRRVGVVSLRLNGYSPQELAGLLESAFRVQVRAGLHCAPRMHGAMGTLDQGGTVRFSVSALNTSEQIDDAVDAMQEIASAELPL